MKVDGDKLSSGTIIGMIISRNLAALYVDGSVSLIKELKHNCHFAVVPFS